MKPYPKYKATNIPWLKEVPEDWEVRKIREIFVERKEKVSDTDFPALSVGYMGVVPQIENAAKTNDGDNRKLIRRGDFAINSRSDRKGAGGFSQYDGSTSQITIVLRPHAEINTQYFHYLFRSNGFIEEYYRIGRGIVSDLWTTRYSEMKNIYIPLPPLPVQSRIVSYLDAKVSAINKLIEAKKRQVELLKEMKQRVIDKELNVENEGVKGIPLKRLLVSPLQYGANDSGLPYDEKLPRYIRITDITLDGKLKYDDRKSLSNAIAKQYLLKDGDILLARSGATAGKAFMYEETYGICAFAGYLIKANFDKKKLLPKFFIYFTGGSFYEEWKNSIFIQATIQNISAERYSYLSIPLPSLCEQHQIVSRLDAKCAKIDHLITKLQDEIALFGEYKTLLISDVVTGKFDVQDIAQQQEADIDAVRAKTIALTPKWSKSHSKGFEDAVILATLVNAFGTDEHPFTAFDCQKFPYLLHRYMEGVAENYGKFAAGPYNPDLKYQTARPIALKKKYIREHTGRYKGWVTDANVQEAVGYFTAWYGNEPLEWIKQFRFISNRKNELELLTTVDMAIVDLQNDNMSVTMQSVKDLIKGSPVWKDKLKRPIFSDANIERAIKWSYKLFGTQNKEVGKKL